MAKWEQLKGRVLRALKAEDQTQPKWVADDVLDYLSFALDAFSAHTARQVLWTKTAATNITRAVLPDDLMALGPVWFPDRRLLSKIDLQPGMLFESETIEADSLPFGYYEWPDGTLNLTRTLGEGETITVQYWAYWPIPANDDADLMIPRWAEEALFWYMISRAMVKSGVSRAQLGQWDTKRQSGMPEDNSPKAYAQWAEDRYRSILAEHPPQDRSLWAQA